MSKVNEFVLNATKMGIEFRDGTITKDGIEEVEKKIKLKDPDDITAEAYNQDIFPSGLPWDEGLKQVKQAISEVKL